MLPPSVLKACAPWFSGSGDYRSSVRLRCTMFHHAVRPRAKKKAAWMKMTPRLVIGGEGQGEETSMLRKKPNASHTQRHTHTHTIPITLTCSVCELQPRFQWWSTLPHLDRMPGPCLPHRAWRPLNSDWEVWGPPLQAREKTGRQI